MHYVQAVLLLIVSTTCAYANKPDIHVSLKPGVLYFVPDDQERASVEAALNRKFPNNELFFSVAYSISKHLCAKEGATRDSKGKKQEYEVDRRRLKVEIWRTLPHYLPYECIKEGVEGKTAELVFYGKMYTVLFNQMKERNAYSTCPFETLRDAFLERFVQSPNFLWEDTAALAQEKILHNDNGCYIHGAHASPVVLNHPLCKKPAYPVNQEAPHNDQH